ncbi:MAG TPA: class I SAM-dependent methyltransferase [Solirubrobacteraceae bacterium]|jgi:hypothetical protein
MIRQRLKRLSPEWQNRLRRLSRLRWLRKAMIVRDYGVSLRERPLGVIRYVLLDPEVGDFSYELDNEGELVGFLAHTLGVDEVALAGYLAEMHSDPTFSSELAQRTRRRIDMKRHIGFGPRIGWYAAVRALKPKLVAETGIKHGLGSLVVLQALQRNAQEGSPGRLISCDLDPFSGWVVPERLRGHWRAVFGSTFDVLDDTLAGEEVDLFICDTPPEDRFESFDVHTAMRHAAPSIVMITGAGNRTTALREMTAELGGRFSCFAERPRHDIYPGAGLGVAVISREISLPTT